ncbi:DUF5988 family protein [Actinomadura sp. WMMB 499]|uniref:DUF5988 family protein n=1 Tax=Actinomadura sp. WMMB 499 TaxID=1219491 RepID=UPI0012444775|nr:DUF5988 family protein [Actinomadura sp. WMMB 499]QFG24772.1 hypothetical protein F7P10_30185 [Actinomadura sp. WMMB 499]
MHQIDQARTGEESIEAVLVGGPDDIPEIARRMRAPAATTKLKLSHRGGYEHFEVDGRPDGSPRPTVFTWTTRTEAAE